MLSVIPSERCSASSSVVELTSGKTARAENAQKILELTALPLPLAEYCPELDPARLAAANINPKTRLATDYLNHFHEAIMLLELLPDTPECIVELIGWEPLSYQEHFAASHFKDKELAIAAYAAAEPSARGRLDELAAILRDAR